MSNLIINRLYKRITRSFDYILKKSQYTDRAKEKSIISAEGSSVSVRDGEIGLSAGKHTHYQLHGDSGSATETSMQSHTITNRKRIDVDEIVVNDHKLNPKLYEWTDMRTINGNNIVGRLQMESTILVKAWDEGLQKHVLIRRPCRQPLFGQTLNVAEPPEQMDINLFKTGVSNRE